MAQQIINNGETGAVVRGKINANFSELYTGPVNRIPKYNAGGGFVPSLLFDDGTNVGIGTITPAANLHVFAPVASKLRVETSGDSAGLQLLTSIGTGSWEVGVNNLGGAFSTGNQWYVSDLIGGGFLLAIQKSSRFVSVGHANPTYQLDVLGTAATQNIIRARSATGHAILAIDYNSGFIGGLRFFEDGAAVSKWTVTSKSGGIFSIADDTAALDRILIDQAGNVGIGTNVPQQRLHVFGGGLFRNINVGNTGGWIDGAVNIFKQSSVNSVNTVLNLGNYFANLGVEASKLAIDFSGGDTGVGINSPTPSGRILVQTSNEPNYMQFEVSQLPVMRLIANGNIGIGSANPQVKLEVIGGVSSYSIGVFADRVDAPMTGVKGVLLWGAGYDGAKYYNAAVGGSVAFNGTNYIVGTDGGGNGGWMMKGENGGDSLNFYIFPVTGVPIQTFSPAAIAAYHKMVIAPNGVGIGTASPQSGLSVFKNADPQGSAIRFSYSTANDAVMRFGFLAGPAGPNTDVMRFSVFNHESAANERDYMSIVVGSGNVGIGTTNPQEKLHVNSDSGPVSAKISAPSGSNSVLLLYTGTLYTVCGFDIAGSTVLANSIPGAFVFGTAYGNPLQLGTNNSPKFTINENGALGFGGGAPNYGSPGQKITSNGPGNSWYWS